MMWWGHGFGWGSMILGGLMMFVFWGALIVLAVVAVRAFLGSNSQRSSGPVNPNNAPGHNRALDILQERYARGEISKAEYEQMREDLKV